VTVVADGTATFTAAGQPYYQYSQIIAPNGTSNAKQWRLDMPATVITCTFTLYVSAPVRYADGWVDLGSARTLTQGTSTTLAPVVRDRLGRPEAGPAVTFASANPAIASVDAAGVVSAVAAGTTTITGTSGSRSGTVAITVQRPVASIEATPKVINLVVGATHAITVTTRDADGNQVYRPVTFQSAAPGTATAGATGTVTGVALGTTTVTATSEGLSDVVTVNVVGPGPSELRGVVVGAYHSCGLAPGGAAYCWGRGASGQLGNGTTHDRATPFAVAGGLAFTSLSAGGNRTCGITTSGAAWCWGKHPTTRFDLSETPVSSAVPAAVPGGHSWVQLDVSPLHACGVTTAGAAYCWGLNDRHQLGIPNTTPSSATPVAVSGGFTFTSVTVGDEHSCGIVPGGAARCWGIGALGTVPTGVNGTPQAVAGGHAFTQLSAGPSHVCGIATGGAAWCWGDGNQGQLGDSLQTDSYQAPVAVKGGLTFALLSSANSLTCGVTTGGGYYCWGAGGYRFGTGTRASGSAVPIAVTQGMAFASLDVNGAAHGCGALAAGAAYCWGENDYGAVGDGSTRTLRGVVGVAQYVVGGGTAIRARR
jgi:alpha-tubulin suppressor-like RCC1 family protein